MTTASSPRRFTLLLIATLAALGVSACGGGGGGSGGGGAVAVSPPPPPPPSPPPPAGSGWVQGSFAAASGFKNRCENPRSGVDAEGRAFPDLPGTGLQERFWLRSWTNETYLWNTEVADRDPGTFTDRLAYFDILKTFARTPSGKDKDDFHFSEPTAQYLASRSSAPTASYGARFAVLQGTRPRDIRVLYTEPGSPAAAVSGSAALLGRGARIVSVNGIDAINGATTQADVNALNAALFPAIPGIVTTFVVRDPGASADRTVTITSANIVSKPVNRIAAVDTPTGKVGYILFNTFSPFASERDIVEAVTSLQGAGINDLVLDLRYNGGGLISVAAQTGYMVVGPARAGNRAFERLLFNAASGNRNPVTGDINQPVRFENTTLGFSLAAGSPLPTLNLPRVFILSTSRTCSASESVINGLRGIGVEVVLIGDTTCGKPFGFYPTDNCGQTYYTIQFQGANDTGFGDYADGFIPNNSPAQFGVRVPGCTVADDYSRELGDPREGLLAAALSYRATGTCPPPAAVSSAAARSPELATPVTSVPAAGDPLALREPAPRLFEVNRDMTPSPSTFRSARP